MSRDDPNLSKLKSKVETVVPHDQVVIQLAPVFNFLYFYSIFWKIAYDFLSHCNIALLTKACKTNRPELAKLEASKQRELLKLLRNKFNLFKNG